MRIASRLHPPACLLVQYESSHEASGFRCHFGVLTYVKVSLCLLSSLILAWQVGLVKRSQEVISERRATWHLTDLVWSYNNRRKVREKWQLQTFRQAIEPYAGNSFTFVKDASTMSRRRLPNFLQRERTKLTISAESALKKTVTFLSITCPTSYLHNTDCSSTIVWGPCRARKVDPLCTYVTREFTIKLFLSCKNQMCIKHTYRCTTQQAFCRIRISVIMLSSLNVFTSGS